MANKAYRSRSGTSGTPSSWSNAAGTTWDVYSTTATGGVFPSGSWTQAGNNDYPTTGDYVWLQSTFVVTYDAIAIAANNAATFAQISARTDATGGLIAQPIGTGGIGASNLGAGYLQFTVASTTTFNATYYAPFAQSTNTSGMFFLNVPSSTTFNFTGTQIQGTTGLFIRTGTSAANSTINLSLSTGLTAGTSGVNCQGLYIDSNNITLNITGNVYGTVSDGLVLGTATGCNVTITGNVYGSDNAANKFGIQGSGNTNTITINGDCYSGTQSSAIYTATQGGTTSVTISGPNKTIRNYGSSGTTYVSAIMANSISIPSTTNIYYKTSDSGNLPFTSTGGGSVSPADFWGYALSQPAFSASNSIGKKLKDWALGSDNKVLLSSDSQTGVTIPTVTTVGTVSGSVGSVTGSVTIASNGISASSFQADALQSIANANWSQSVAPYTDPAKFGGLINQVNTNLSGLQVVTTNVNTNVGGAQAVIATVNTNLSSAQQVLGTVQGVTKSTQNVVDILNTNLTSAQQVLGSVQTVTLSTQGTALSIQSTGETNKTNILGAQTVLTKVDTEVMSIQTVTGDINTNVSGAQVVLTTTNNNVISAQTVLTNVNSNVNSVQQVTGNIQQVTLSTQTVVDSIQSVTGTPQDISDQVWQDFDNNPNNSPYIQRVHNVSTVDTTGQQISTI